MNKESVVAEIGCNHKGDMDIAKEMIKVAAQFCRADVAKFQKRNPRELLTEAEYNSPHPEPYHAYGETYGEHREFLEFSKDQHQELKECCEEWNIIYSASVWDMTSAKEITSLNPKYIKVPSACNTNLEMLSFLCDGFGGDIHISLGMTSHDEETQIVELLQNKKRAKDAVIYASTSAYPVEFEDLSLLEITRLINNYGDVVKEVGFSGHHKGIAADIAALTLGARWIERHFTLDRAWKGTDHAASLEPDGLRRVVRDLKAVEQALKYKSKEILEVEKDQRDKLKWKKDKK